MLCLPKQWPRGPYLTGLLLAVLAAAGLAAALAIAQQPPAVKPPDPLPAPSQSSPGVRPVAPPPTPSAAPTPAEIRGDGAKQPPANESDIKAIQATADAFVKAFDSADAKAIGAMWADDAEYTDEAGVSFRGRAAIESEYAALFKAHPGATVTLAIESIRFLGPNLAIEKGVAKVKSPKIAAESAARYSVVHAKRDGQWIMEVGHDTPYVPATNGEYLKDLEWLVGDWVPDAKDSTLHFNFEWLANQNFMKGIFVDAKNGALAATGLQIIGWNPKLGRIVAWHFDAEGDFGTNLWTKDDAKWVIEASGIRRDGSETSAVNIVIPIDANSFSWQSVRRTLDGVHLPDVGPVKFVRAKPNK